MSDSPLAAIISGWGGRSAFAVVDLDAIATNVATVLARIGEGTSLMAVVKANGYGHGAVPVARTALAAGATSLGVATVDEGAQLRAAGIEAPILVFSPIGQHERGRAIGQRLGLVVADASFAKGLAAEVKAALVKEPTPVHFKIDTGMRRFGAAASDAVEVATTIAGLEQLRLEGVMTHFASADAADPAATKLQASTFDAAVQQLREAGIDIPVRHLCNSAATLRFPELHHDLVRLGIAMYGLVPDASMPLPRPMRPALTVYGRLGRVFDLAPGDGVGYGGTYRAERPERAALVPIGYADGYRRAFSSRAWMAVRGQRADVIGRVSMDQVVIRVPEGLEVEAGEPVVIVGDRTAACAAAPGLDDLAALAGAIGYELATGLAPRLPKLYARDGQVVAVADLHGYRELT